MRLRTQEVIISVIGIALAVFVIGLVHDWWGLGINTRTDWLRVGFALLAIQGVVQLVMLVRAGAAGRITSAHHAVAGISVLASVLGLILVLDNYMDWETTKVWLTCLAIVSVAEDVMYFLDSHYTFGFTAARRP